LIRRAIYVRFSAECLAKASAAHWGDHLGGMMADALPKARVSSGEPWDDHARAAWDWMWWIEWDDARDAHGFQQDPLWKSAAAMLEAQAVVVKGWNFQVQWPSNHLGGSETGNE
jgi:hypothetical protein